MTENTTQRTPSEEEIESVMTAARALTKAMSDAVTVHAPGLSRGEAGATSAVVLAVADITAQLMAAMTLFGGPDRAEAVWRRYAQRVHEGTQGILEATMTELLRRGAEQE